MSVPAISARPDYQVLQAAAEWFALLRSEEVDASDSDALARWQAWLEARPAHREAWRRVEAINQRFNGLPAEPSHEALRAGGRKRRQLLKAAALGCVALFAGTQALRSRTLLGYWHAQQAQYRTAIGQTAQMTLADGTSLWLNTDSAADVLYSADLRRIMLHKGEALITTAHDTQQPARPLVVDVADGRMRALGTRFNVRVFDDATELAVFEGAVEVAPSGDGAPRVIPAGARVRFNANGIASNAPAEEERAAWIRGVLVADGMSLDDFCTELGRYRRGHLSCAPDVANLRLVGVYPLADTDKVLAAVAASLPVKVRYTMPWWVSVEAR